MARQFQRQRELFSINREVCAQFEPAAQSHEIGPHRMGVPAPFQMRRLGPGVGIKQKMMLQRPPALARQPPEVDQIGSEQGSIVRQDTGSSQTGSRPIHTQNTAVGKAPSQFSGGSTSTAASIQNDPATGPITQRLERGSTESAQRLSPGLGEMALNRIFKPRVDP